MTFQQTNITITFWLRDLFSGFPPYFELIKLNPAPLKIDPLINIILTYLAYFGFTDYLKCILLVLGKF